ncbi:MAG: anti-sigma factor family protein, partial [Nitrospiraceae bacterium]
FWSRGQPGHLLAILRTVLGVMFVIGGLKLLFRGVRPTPMQFRCRTVVDLILAYLEGTLPRKDRRAFEAHIADCKKCWRFLKTYRHTVELGQELREDTIPSDVHQRLESFLRDRLSHS